jgi:hypothetical protein
MNTNQMAGDLQDSIREIQKWLNEEQGKPINRVALASVLWAVQTAEPVATNSNLHLSELMRGLELHPSLGSPNDLFLIGCAIAAQAKANATPQQATPTPETPIAWLFEHNGKLGVCQLAEREAGDIPVYATPQQAASIPCDTDRAAMLKAAPKEKP